MCRDIRKLMGEIMHAAVERTQKVFGEEEGGITVGAEVGKAIADALKETGLAESLGENRPGEHLRLVSVPLFDGAIIGHAVCETMEKVVKAMPSFPVAVIIMSLPGVLLRPLADAMCGAAMVLQQVE